MKMNEIDNLNEKKMDTSNCDINISLIDMCKNNNEQIVKMLIENGANINSKDKHGDTPLTIACTQNKDTLVKYLVEGGANINISNDNCDTPLIIMCKNNNECMIKYLVEHKADVNKKKINMVTHQYYCPV